MWLVKQIYSLIARAVKKIDPGANKMSVAFFLKTEIALYPRVPFTSMICYYSIVVWNLNEQNGPHNVSRDSELSITTDNAATYSDALW